MQYRTSSGQAIQTGKRLGQGAEGAIFEISDSAQLVAKIYHHKISDERTDKLKSMMQMRTDLLSRDAAWPVDVLYNNARQPCGFVMPYIQHCRNIHTLYTPKNRKEYFPQADWRFLVRTAANVARTFSIVHDHGCVIGDVNHSSVLAATDATVKLIDCDSFQVINNGKTFFCEVGVPSYTPPELQNKPFKGMERTKNHDAFGLAVMIFELLFMGRHPFAGRCLVSEEMPIEKAIAEFRFAYSRDQKRTFMEPPPHTLLLNEVPSNIANLFERAFSQEGTRPNGRPSANEWVSAIEGLEPQLKKCNDSSSHYYFGMAPRCPWCRIELATGAFLFPASVPQGHANGTFNLASIWKTISALQLPAALPPLPSTIPKASPSPEVAAIKSALRKRAMLLASIVGVGFVAYAYISSGLFYVLMACLAGIMIKFGQDTPDASPINTSYMLLKSKWDNLSARWSIENGQKRFNDTIQELQRIRAQLEQLPSERQKKLQQLHNDRYRIQLGSFLDRFPIERAEIAQIGRSRKDMLRSYNIETAADIVEFRVRAVPGFGDAYTKKLLSWRRSIEQKFVFNANQGINPREIANLETTINTMRVRLEQQMMNGVAEISRIRNHIVYSQQAMMTESQALLSALSQAKADIEHLGGI